MAESAAPQGTTSTLPPPSVNGSTRSPPAPHVPHVPHALHAPPALPAPRAPRRLPLSTWIRGLRAGQIAGAGAVIAVVIFIIQNPHAINISFLGVHLVLPQAMALLLAVLAGALLTAGPGSARITQLRRIMGRDQRKPPAS
jgi:lipopolysaccharide assembly protein A